LVFASAIPSAKQQGLGESFSFLIALCAAFLAMCACGFSMLISVSYRKAIVLSVVCSVGTAYMRGSEFRLMRLQRPSASPNYPRALDRIRIMGVQSQ
jgi:hypothetical protein